MTDVMADHTVSVQTPTTSSDAPSSSTPSPTTPPIGSAGELQEDYNVEHQRAIEPSTDVQSPPTSPPKVLKPSKKTTVDQLRAALSAIGLNAAGKKETIYKRLLKAFYRSEEPDPSLSERSEPEKPAVKSYEERLAEAQEDWQAFLCFDVEATCRGTREFDWPNEIIFPVVLLKWVDVSEEGDSADRDDPPTSQHRKRRLERVDTFHTYVRPVWSPTLTQYCTSLTGITQEKVDKSPTFPEVLKLLEIWLDKHDLREEDGRLKNAVWVTDGPWDLRDFIPKQLHITPVDPHRPPYLFGQYLNIKQATQTVLCELWCARQGQSITPTTPARPATPAAALDPLEPDHELTNGQLTVKPETASSEKVDTPRPVDEEPINQPTDIITTHRSMSKALREGKWKGPKYYFSITGQVDALGLGDFTGRQHSGLDDAINISRILIALSEKDRVIIEPNARTPHPKHMKNWPWMGKTPGVVKFEEWMSRGSGLNPYSAPNGIVDSTEEEATERGTKEEMVWDLKEDAAGAMRAVKVPLSEATEATQKMVEQKKAVQRKTDEVESVQEASQRQDGQKEAIEGQTSSPTPPTEIGATDQLIAKGSSTGNLTSEIERPRATA